MPVFALDERLVFPDPALAAPGGLLAVGGDLSPERIILAYQHGIFPWFGDGDPILWHSPEERWVLPPRDLRLGRTSRKELRRIGDHAVTFDAAFDDVIAHCRDAPRRGQDGTWITADMVEAYAQLAELGLAHAAEVWAPDGALVGGLYGISLGGAFFGESMFQRRTGASKAALGALCMRAAGWGFSLIDAQVHTPLLERCGAHAMSREAFREALTGALAAPTRRGSWAAAPGAQRLRVADVLAWHDGLRD